MSLSAAELLSWGHLDERRRRRARGVVGQLTAPRVVVPVASVALALDLVRRIADPDPNIGPIALALMSIAFANILVVFGTPFRMFWRHDSSLLARLNLDGTTLFALAAARTVRAAALALVPGLAAVVVFAAHGATDVALRVGAVALASGLLAGLLSPAACLAGGAIVASDRAQAMVDALGGEFHPPPVAWLGALPSFVGIGVALLSIIVAPWVSASEPLFSSPLLVLLGGGAAGVIGLALAWFAAPRVLIDAQREVAALDQERLAHIEKSTAGPLERLWAAVFCRQPMTRHVFNKDAALLRRRYPAPYFVSFVGVVATWILAVTSQLEIALALIAALAVYASVMARRQVVRPVELVNLIRSLPIAEDGVKAAKRRASLLRAIFWVGVPAVSVVVTAESAGSSAIAPAFALLFALVSGTLFSVVRADND